MIAIQIVPKGHHNYSLFISKSGFIIHYSLK